MGSRHHCYCITTTTSTASTSQFSGLFKKLIFHPVCVKRKLLVWLGIFMSLLDSLYLFSYPTHYTLSQQLTTASYSSMLHLDILSHSSFFSLSQLLYFLSMYTLRCSSVIFFFTCVPPALLYNTFTVQRTLAALVNGLVYCMGKE